MLDTVKLPKTPPRKPGRPALYPFTTMKKGEAFIAPSEGKTLTSFQSYCSQRSRVLRRQFRVRVVFFEDVAHFEVRRVS